MNAPDQMPRTPQPATRLEYVVIVLVLLLAAYLRLNHLEWTEFKTDEAHLSQLAYDMARHGQIPLTGIGSSVGIVNPPLAAWLFALPYALSADPIVATGFVAVLNVLAVALSYGLARKLFAAAGGDRAWLAAAAALLFAAAPWAVIYSRKVWAQDLLPLFVCLYAWTGYRVFVQRKAWSLLGHGLCLAALIQIHYSALWLIPVSAVWAVAFVRRLRFKAVLAAALIFVAAFTPFVIADAQRGWPSVNRLFEIFSQPATTDVEALHYAWLMSTGFEIHSLAGPQEFENFRSSVLNIDGLLLLEGLLALAGLGLALFDVVRAIRRRTWDDRSAISGLLATWLLMPILIQLSHRTALFPHYFIILYPVQFLLIGWLIARWPWSWRWTRWIVLVGVILIALAQSYQTLALEQFVATRSTPGAFGIPIGYFNAITDQAKALAHEKGAAEFVVDTRGSDPMVDEYPAIFDFLLNDTPHRFVDVGQSIDLYPIQPFVQIIFDPGGHIAGSDGRVNLRLDEEPARVALANGSASAACAASRPAVWANGGTLRSIDLVSFQPGQSASIRVCVQVNAPAPADYHWTNQLFDALGKRWAQVDDAGYLARYWRTGDVIIQSFKIDLPVDLPIGAYKLRIGQYTYPELANVPVLDSAGKPQSDAVEIPVTVVR